MFSQRARMLHRILLGSATLLAASTALGDPLDTAQFRWDLSFPGVINKAPAGLDSDASSVEVLGEWLYIGGSFSTASGVAAPGIVRFTTNNGVDAFERLGEGLQGSSTGSLEVLDMAVFTNPGDAAPSLWVVGEFPGFFELQSGQLVQVPSRNIARWDGERWHAVQLSACDGGSAQPQFVSGIETVEYRGSQRLFITTVGCNSDINGPVFELVQPDRFEPLSGTLADNSYGYDLASIQLLPPPSPPSLIATGSGVPPRFRSSILADDEQSWTTGRLGEPCPLGVYGHEGATAFMFGGRAVFVGVAREVVEFLSLDPDPLPSLLPPLTCGPLVLTRGPMEVLDATTLNWMRIAPGGSLSSVAVSPTLTNTVVKVASLRLRSDPIERPRHLILAGRPTTDSGVSGIFEVDDRSATMLVLPRPDPSGRFDWSGLLSLAPPSEKYRTIVQNSHLLSTLSLPCFDCDPPLFRRDGGIVDMAVYRNVIYVVGRFASLLLPNDALVGFNPDRPGGPVALRGVARWVCPTDFNHDGFVDQDDLSSFINAFLESPSVPDCGLVDGPAQGFARPCLTPAPGGGTALTNGCPADFNQDCVVDQEDLAAAITAFLDESQVCPTLIVD